MKLLLSTMIVLCGLSTAQAFQMELTTGNEEVALARCRALIGEAALLRNVRHLAVTKPGLSGGITVKYVLADCVDRALGDGEAALRLAGAVAAGDHDVAGTAIRELLRLEIRTPDVLAAAARGLRISQVFVANDVMVFLSKGGRPAVDALRGLVSDEARDVRHKATYALYLVALETPSALPASLLAELEERYFVEHSESGFTDPYPLGVKLNVARIFSETGGASPRLIEKMVADLCEYPMSHELAITSYSGGGQVGATLVSALGKMGDPVVPALERALIDRDGGPYVNGESFPLLAAEALGPKGKALIPALRRILEGGQSPYPKRVELAIERLSR